MQQLNAIQDKDLVTVVVNHRRVMSLGWKAARDLCDLMRGQLRQQQDVESVLKVGPAEVSFRRQPKLDDEHEDMLLCIVNGRLVFDAPISKATECWRLLISAQRAAEEWAKADRIAADAGLLLRTGAPIGLTNHPKIQEEAVKVATGDRTLRRALPGGVKSKAVIGAPSVFHDMRTPVQRAAAMFAQLGPDERKLILKKLA